MCEQFALIVKFHLYNWLMKIKHPEFQIAYVDIQPKNILIFDKLKPKRHDSFLDILSREKKILFVSSHVSVGIPEREGGGRALLVSHLLEYCLGDLLYI